MAARTPRKNAGVGSKVGSVNAPTTKRKPRGTKPRVTKSAAEKQKEKKARELREKRKTPKEKKFEQERAKVLRERANKGGKTPAKSKASGPAAKAREAYKAKMDAWRKAGKSLRESLVADFRKYKEDLKKKQEAALKKRREANTKKMNAHKGKQPKRPASMAPASGGKAPAKAPAKTPRKPRATKK